MLVKQTLDFHIGSSFDLKVVADAKDKTITVSREGFEPKVIDTQSVDWFGKVFFYVFRMDPDCELDHHDEKVIKGAILKIVSAEAQAIAIGAIL
ncbi:hypothetical protein Acj9p042 [Acinetobacter phage Acj9]|uniref:Uncharacterized protein n=1 Tax=Acinetobacter phage Acj9 TaxID=760939 RepID=E5EPH6_9CAUD|nr:hypothetical protein Acj9p042 [Acinetobacter phage Acj9]ADG59942.1 hypothetical protein Acj9p042 [Acinetobacter phage Acj9]